MVVKAFECGSSCVGGTPETGREGAEDVGREAGREVKALLNLRLKRLLVLSAPSGRSTAVIPSVRSVRKASIRS